MKYTIITITLLLSADAYAQTMSKQEREQTCKEVLSKINGHLNKVTDKDRIKDNKHLNIANLLALSYAQMRCDGKALYDILK